MHCAYTLKTNSRPNSVYVYYNSAVVVYNIIRLGWKNVSTSISVNMRDKLNYLKFFENEDRYCAVIYVRDRGFTLTV